LYCGKEIGPFRLLRDTEFCSSAHRTGYRARLGKALNQIAAHQPPPAPLASFIPYKPLPGNNRSPLPVWTLQYAKQEFQLSRTWPVAVVPLARERAAPLPLLQPYPPSAAAFFVQARPQSRPDGPPIRRPHLELRAADPLPALAQIAPESDPAGPEPLDLSAADSAPGAPSVSHANSFSATVRLPGRSPGTALVRPPDICGPAGSLQAQIVEAFLPPGPGPQLLACAVRVTPPRLAVSAIEWLVAADLAQSVAAPAAQPVEAFLQPAAEPRPAAWPAAVVTLPRWATTAAQGPVAVDLAEPVAAPAAQPVEAFLPPAAESQPAAWPAASLARPLLQLDAATDNLPLSGRAPNWVSLANLAQPVPSLAAQAVEALLPLATEPRIAVWPAAAVAVPRLLPDPIDWVVSTPVADPAMAPAAQAVETFLTPAAEPQIAAWPAAALRCHFPIPVVSGEIAGPVPSPAAQAVEAFLPPAAEPQIAAWAAAAAALPRSLLTPIDWVVSTVVAEPVPSPAAQAVEAFLPPAAEPCALPPSIAAFRLPGLTLTAAEPEPVEEFVPPLVVAPPCERWMPSPPDCEVVREVTSAWAGPLPATAALQTPAAQTLAIEQSLVRYAGDWRTSAPAEPVCADVAPRPQPALAFTFAVSVPGMRALRSHERTPGGRHAAQLAAPAQGNYPNAAESVPALAHSPEEESGRWQPAIQLPVFGVGQTNGNQCAAFQSGEPSAAEPGAAAPKTPAAIPRPDPTGLTPPGSPAVDLACRLPVAEPVGLDFFCQRASMGPVESPSPIAARIPVHPPKFVVRPLFERIEEAVATPQPAPTTPTFAEIFALSKGPRRHTNQGSLYSTGKAIAAGLLVGVGIWFGAGTVKISRQMVAINNALRGMGSGSSAPEANSPAPPPGFPAVRPAPESPQGPIAVVRRAIQRRAAVEFTDTFHRMEAWGDGARALPSGWSRHSNGSVRAGQLAIFRPAENFVDYRFEFFGEIERKSVSWAIRAHNTQNYYAMKMTIIEPGLRPVIAVEHYPVVGGRKGRRIETPLSVMVHNHEPYHVAVDVTGNRVVTSIEGQEVDSWTDDVLKVGGVGFFSEAGESARLYWMRVSKNEDWLGRICAYLSSGSGTDTADLWRGEVPPVPSQPLPSPLPTGADATLAAAETEEFSQVGSQRARILKYGRTEPCRS